MQAIIWILGAVIISEGVAFLIKPDLLKKLLALFAHGHMIYIPAVFRLILGPIFLIYAMSCKIPWIIITFGIFMLIGSAILFLMNTKKIKSILQWWIQQPAWAIRSIAVITLILGAIMVVSGLPQ